MSKDMPDSKSKFDEAVKHKINRLEELQEKSANQIEDLHSELYRNGFLAQITEMLNRLTDVEETQEKKEERKYNFKHDIAVAVISAGIGSIVTVALYHYFGIT